MLADILLLLTLLFAFTLYYKVYRNTGLITMLPAPLRKLRWYPDKAMRHAGLMPAQIVRGYYAVKLLLAGLAILAPQELALGLNTTISVLIVCFAFFLPDLWILNKAKARKLHIEKSLSFFLDQLNGFLLCGLSLDRALTQATEYGLPPDSPLRQELDFFQHQIASGRSRDAALDMLTWRTGVKELQSLVMVLKTGFQIGGSIIPTLQHHSELLRLRQREKSLKRINAKLMVSMLPLVMANFPIFLLLVFFNPAIELSRMFPQFGF